MRNILHNLAEEHRHGKALGMASICSAHPTVLKAVMRRAARQGKPVLIEATCNQVNQDGGYTGMTPAAFVDFVLAIADREQVSREQIIFGGDHLGPNPWKSETAAQALEKAGTMVAGYVAAGFGKIHLDASMGCAGEPQALDNRTVAERAAALCAIAEQTSVRLGVEPPVYVLGTEVPVPGGADHLLSALEPTRADDARETIRIHREAFARVGLSAAFERVIAFVVQPGVEFGSDNVIAYDPQKAAALNSVLKDEPALVFEAHSTDYQSPAALAALVRDGFPILKVGPAVTFAYRQALYGLDLIAAELVRDYPRQALRNAMESLMTASPEHWKNYYRGDERAMRLQRHFSYSDRIRYYWARPEAEAAVERLSVALRGVRIPEPLMRQFLPQLRGEPSDTMEDILIAAIDQVLADYDRAAGLPSG